MANIFKKIYNILKDGIMSPLYNDDGTQRSKTEWTLYNIFVPLIIFVLSLSQTTPLNDVNGILTVSGIFISLIFVMLIILPDRLRQKNNSYLTGEKFKKYTMHLNNMVKSLTQQMSFIIIVGVILIILTVIYKIFTNIIIAGLILTLFYYLMLYILSVITIVHSIITDNVNETKILND